MTDPVVRFSDLRAVLEAIVDTARSRGVCIVEDGGLAELDRIEAARRGEIQRAQHRSCCNCGNASEAVPCRCDCHQRHDPPSDLSALSSAMEGPARVAPHIRPPFYFDDDTARENEKCVVCNDTGAFVIYDTAYACRHPGCRHGTTKQAPKGSEVVTFSACPYCSHLHRLDAMRRETKDWKPCACKCHTEPKGSEGRDQTTGPGPVNRESVVVGAVANPKCQQHEDGGLNRPEQVNGPAPSSSSASNLAALDRAMGALRKLSFHYVDHFGRAEVRAAISAYDAFLAKHEGKDARTGGVP